MDIIYILPLPLVPLYSVLYTRIELGILRGFFFVFPLVGTKREEEWAWSEFGLKTIRIGFGRDDSQRSRLQLAACGKTKKRT
jgi:hypothetical protein